MRKGFTLIELLFIIALIPILWAILLPVRQKSPEIARQTNCTSNQRKIFEAIMTYAEDNNETLPGTLPVDANNHLSWLTALDLSKKVLQCKDSTACPSYNFAADLVGANLGAVNSDNRIDALLTADGAFPNRSQSTNGLISTNADIALTIHGQKGFIASFLDGHIQSINSNDIPLYNAIDLTNATAGSISYSGVTNINAILYQGAQHVFTYDATAGTMTGAPFITPAMLSDTVHPTLQYFAVEVINVPPANNTNISTTIIPAITMSVNTAGKYSTPISVVNFGTPSANDLRGNMYYTYSVDNSARGVAHTLLATSNLRTLVLTIN
jgi:type II secretory pathway pseudopilin PulG